MKHLAGIDLNLLVAFDALLAERSVTRAGRRVGLSQPAMSHALSRLRELLDDEVLVRIPGGMSPTARAEALAPRVRALLEETERCLHDRPGFHPESSDRTFTVAASDYAGALLIPQLIASVRAVAPEITIRVRPLPASIPVGSLAEGVLDLAIGTYPELSEQVEHRTLYEDTFSCLVPESLDLSDFGPERFAGFDHVLVSSPREARGLIDDALEQLGLRRRVAVYLPHFLTVPDVIAASDSLVATIPTKVAQWAASRGGVKMVRPPIALRTIPVSVLWHRRYHGDPAHAWLRGVLEASTAA